MSSDFWATKRQQYRKLAGLCVAIDNAISEITLLAISNNLFFISVQLLRSIRWNFHFFQFQIVQNVLNRKFHFDLDPCHPFHMQFTSGSRWCF